MHRAGRDPVALVQRRQRARGEVRIRQGDVAERYGNAGPDQRSRHRFAKFAKFAKFADHRMVLGDDRLVKPVEMATLDALLQRVVRDLLPDAWPAMCVVHLFAVREPAVEV